VVEHLASPRPGYPGFNFQYCIKKKRDRERERERERRERMGFRSCKIKGKRKKCQ
jgi:hypothetical protein